MITALVILATRPGTTSSSLKPALSAEQKAYLNQIVITEARMTAAESFAGNRLIYLNARVTNQGPKVVRRLGIEMNFHDILNQVVLRENAHPISSRTPPLQPGETRAFQVIFERLPPDWNQAPPAIAATDVSFD